VTESLGASAAVVTVAFLGVGVLLGAVGGFLGVRRATPPRGRADHLPHFALVALGIMLSLIFVGGLVTSTRAGMAVPDWPSTFGSNMLLYPLGPTVPISVFLEHAHRLFGMLLGATVLTLTVWTLVSSRSRLVKGWAVALFLLVCLQGLLGGERVIRNAQALALVHGVSAQLLAAGLAMLAAYLSPAYAGALHAPRPARVRRARALVTASMHSLLLQIALGAAYRHFPNAHGLWTHAIFALVVAVLVALAGFAAGALRGEHDADLPHFRAARCAGTTAATLVGVQFLLGWFAFFMAGDTHAATAPLHVLVRTAHQANGALLVAATAWMFVMVRQINRSPAETATT
jgi:cytochrome c oxidase assembly protein subunit 15